MKVFIDTGVFLSISDKSDAFNKLVSSVYQRVVEQNAILYTSNYIIDETITLPLPVKALLPYAVYLHPTPSKTCFQKFPKFCNPASCS